MSTIEIGPRVLTESSAVTTVGLSVKEAEVEEVSAEQGSGAGEGVIRAETGETGKGWATWLQHPILFLFLFFHGKIQF